MTLPQKQGIGFYLRAEKKALQKYLLSHFFFSSKRDEILPVEIKPLSKFYAVPEFCRNQ